MRILNCFRYQSFQPNRACDSHEVMRCILDAIRMEEIKVCFIHVFVHTGFNVKSTVVQLGRKQ